MFESLTEKFQRVFKGLRGQASLNEENTREALREIRVALLEADVALEVVKNFVAAVRDRAGWPRPGGPGRTVRASGARW